MTDDEILEIAIPKLGDWNGSIFPFARAIIAQARAELIAEMEVIGWVFPVGARTVFTQDERAANIAAKMYPVQKLAIIPNQERT